jgi:hypothetical protein
MFGRAIAREYSPYHKESGLRLNHVRGSGSSTWTYYGLHVEVPYARAGLRQDNLLSVTTRDKRRSGCRSYKGHQVGVSESE